MNELYKCDASTLTDKQKLTLTYQIEDFFGTCFDFVLSVRCVISIVKLVCTIIFCVCLKNRRYEKNFGLQFEPAYLFMYSLSVTPFK